MDIKLKQRILGVIILIALLSFCLSLLIKGYRKDTQPHIAKIDTHPPVMQTVTLPSLSSPMPDRLIPEPQPADIKNLADKYAQTLSPIKNTSIAPEKSNAILPGSSAQTTKNLSLPTPNTQNSAVKQAAPQSKTIKIIKNKTKIKNIPKEKRQIASKIKSTVVIQAGTFRIAANAEKLVNMLRKKGFSAHAEPINTAKGKMTRVIVSEKNLNEKNADALRKKLEKTSRLSGMSISSI